MKMAELFKWVENTVGKGEIAHYDFSFSHSVLKKSCTEDTYKTVCLGKG